MGKDPVSGKQGTHEYMVEGPVMIFLTTTAQQVDEELLNRSIVLSVNEDREQTRAIHRKQREAQRLGLPKKTNSSYRACRPDSVRLLLRPATLREPHSGGL